MKIFIDGNSNLVDCDDQDKLGSILTELEKWLRDNGLAILEIRLDDNIITPEKRLHFGEESVGQFRELHLTSINIKDLSEQVLTEARSHLPKLSLALGEAVSNAQMGKTTEAMGTHFRNAIDIWGAVRSALTDVCQLGNIDIADLKCEKGRADQVFQMASSAFGNARDALSSSDFVTLTDVLEYELPPLVKSFDELIRMLTEKIRGQQLRQVVTPTDAQNAELWEKAESGLRESVVLADDLPQKISAAEKLLEKGDHNESIKSLTEVINVWHNLIACVVTYGNARQINWSVVPFRNTSVEERLLAIKNSIDDFQKYLTRADFTSLIDILEYELLPAALVWRELVEAVLKNARRPGD